MKTKLRKKLVCAVLSVCMAASMAPCGSDSSSATAASSGANHHTPEFDIAEEGLLYGVAAALGYVLNYFRAIPHKSSRESDERFFVRKRCKTTGILCVFQGFTNEFLAKKIRQNPQTHLCGVDLGVRRVFPDFSPSQEAWKI